MYHKETSVTPYPGPVKRFGEPIYKNSKSRYFLQYIICIIDYNTLVILVELVEELGVVEIIQSKMTSFLLLEIVYKSLKPVSVSNSTFGSFP